MMENAYKIKDPGRALVPMYAIQHRQLAPTRSFAVAQGPC